MGAKPAENLTSCKIFYGCSNNESVILFLYHCIDCIIYCNSILYLYQLTVTIFYPVLCEY